MNATVGRIRSKIFPRKTTGYLYLPYKNKYINLIKNKIILSSERIEIKVEEIFERENHEKIDRANTAFNLKILKIGEKKAENFSITINFEGTAKFVVNGFCILGHDDIVKEKCKKNFKLQDFKFIPKSMAKVSEESSDYIFEFDLNENFHKMITSEEVEDLNLNVNVNDFENEFENDFEDESNYSHTNFNYRKNFNHRKNDIFHSNNLENKIRNISKIVKSIRKKSKKSAIENEFMNSGCIKNPENGECYYIENENGDLTPVFDENIVESKKTCKLKRSLDREICEIL